MKKFVQAVVKAFLSVVAVVLIRCSGADDGVDGFYFI